MKWRYYKAIHTLKITLSNLSMFIITFVFGIIILKNDKKELPVIKMIKTILIVIKMKLKQKIKKMKN